jgi:gallate dioxygenase
MARIVGAVASSHTPTIGFALDKQKQDDPVWAPIFEGYKPVQEWLAAKKPDVLSRSQMLCGSRRDKVPGC